MADLSRRFGEREAELSTVDPRAAAASRRAALRAYDRARRRRLNMALAGAVAAIALGDLAYVALGSGAFGGGIDDGPAATPPTQVVSNDPPARLETAAPKPDPAPAPETTPQVAPPVTPQVTPQAPPQIKAQAAAKEPAPASQPTPAPSPPAKADATARNEAPPTTALAPAPAPDPGRLPREEIREVQTRLRGFGFNPGPIDGNAGRMTQAAIQRYQQDRSRMPTGAVDRQLLEELRQDPAPQVTPPPPQPTQVAQRNPRSADYASASQPRVSTPASNALASIRAASDRLAQWFQTNMPR